MRDVIRWGIIGCGDVTEVKSGPGLRLAQGSRVVAVMRRRRELAADYARRHGVGRFYDDARALVNDPEVDAVYVATPPGVHLEGALLAAEAGKPAYVEKPMARHTAECDAMLAAFAATKRKLFVAYYRRALPRFLKVRELLEGGTIGRLSAISYRMAAATAANSDPLKRSWRLDATDSGGGLFLDVGSHVLDLIDFYAGPLPLEHVHGHATRRGDGPGVEDVVSMSFMTRDGIAGAAVFNYATTAKEDVLELTGTTGRIALSVFGAEPVQLHTASRTEQFDLPYPPHIAQPLIQTVVDDLLGRGRCPSTGESARRTQRVMDRVLEAYYGGRHDAFWARPGSWPGAQGTPSSTLPVALTS